MNFRQLPTEEETQNALRWIVEILRHKQIPFQIVGGLAARAYGSTRALVDIDMYVPGKFLESLAVELKEYVTFGPKHVKEEFWDITYMALFYGNQKIEIGDSSDAKIFDPASQIWIEQTIRFDCSVDVSMYEITVPIIPKEQLLEYKSILGRPVDVDDIQRIQACS